MSNIGVRPSKALRRSDAVTPDDWDFGQGLKLAAVAVVCALLTATVVIALGEAVLSRQSFSAPSPPLALTAQG